MKPSPQLFGAVAGVLAAAGFVAWQRLRPPPCTGGVFLELRPPLAEAGPYHFRLLLDGGPEVCEFEVSLPVRESIDKRRCRRLLKLETRVEEGVTSLVGLALGASPDELTFELKRGADTIYNVELTPRYSPYEVRREDDRRFCGDRAFVQPACRRGSPECLPFRPNCDGPEDCAGGRVCCANPERGKEYGAKVASECRFRRSCQDGFGELVCHTDADCPNDMACEPDPLAKDFSPALSACRERKRAGR
jgi:hypothetical protein